MKDILTQGLAQLDITPPPEAMDQLCRYAQLLVEQNKVMNLTAITDPEGIARLHFLDSAALLPLCGGAAGKSLIDVGTGAGFPGLVLKILCPELKLTLLDSLGKRVNWLSQVARELGLPILARLPIDPALAAACDAGKVEGAERNYLEELAAQLDR